MTAARDDEGPLLPWNWTGDDMHTGGERWNRDWRDLGSWVEWYTATFELWAVIPVCWFEHARLVEELRALRHYHRMVFAPAIPRAPDGTFPTKDLPTAKDHWDWQAARREWEKEALGVDPRAHGGCGGQAHVATPDSTAKGQEERRQRMRDGLEAMLERLVARRRTT